MRRNDHLTDGGRTQFQILVSCTPLGFAFGQLCVETFPITSSRYKKYYTRRSASRIVSSSIFSFDQHYGKVYAVAHKYYFVVVAEGESQRPKSLNLFFLDPGLEVTVKYDIWHLTLGLQLSLGLPT